MSTHLSELHTLINVRVEIDAILGPGKGDRRRCFHTAAHAADDKDPSLTFAKDGHWACMASGCGVKGRDVIALYQQAHGLAFGPALRYFLEKYGLWKEMQKKERLTRKVLAKDQRDAHYVPMGKLPMGTKMQERDLDELAKRRKAQQWLRKSEHHGEEWAVVLEILQHRYGIPYAEAVEFGFGWEWMSKKLWIPIYQVRQPGDTSEPGIVNIRKHDIARLHCAWYHGDTYFGRAKGVGPLSPHAYPPGLSYLNVITQSYDAADGVTWDYTYHKDKIPKGSGATGSKSTSVLERGGAYVYPAQVLVENELTFVVGGELKADMLNCLNVPAWTVTGGEGTTADDFSHLLLGKRFRVLMDADGAAVRDRDGYSGADRAAVKVAQWLADSGAESVEWGYWPEATRAELPAKGDVTDLLVRNSLNVRLLDTAIKWVPVERQGINFVAPPTLAVEGDGPPRSDDWQEVRFSQLADPELIEHWVNARCMITGETGSSYAIPHRVTATCPRLLAGQLKVLEPQCSRCALPAVKGELSKKISVDTQLEMIGCSAAKIKSDLPKIMGVTLKCPAPEFKIDWAAARKVVLCPSIDHKEGGDDGYGHQVAYLMSNKQIEVRENTGYVIGGKVISEPKSGTYTLAATQWRPSAGDIFNWSHKKEYRKVLQEHLGQVDPHVAVYELCEILERDVVRQVFGHKEMLLSIFLTFFLPFNFEVGGQQNQTICPHVVILGESNTGKSSATNAIMEFFKAGRFTKADSNLTFAGLIGGNATLGNSNVFRWGILPNSHRGILALDEMGKLDPAILGKFTSTLSSGEAERGTVSGDKKTLCHVRMLSLSNPRGDRRLSAYPNKITALEQLLGTQQDLRRVDYAHIQLPVKDDSIYLKPANPQETWYTREVARYHLSWAWTLKGAQLHFRDPSYLAVESLNLAREFGDHPLLMKAGARFKVGRIAAGFAIMLHSTNTEETAVNVENVHVDLATEFLRSRYEPHFVKTSAAGAASTLPLPLIQLLDQIKYIHRLRFILTATDWSDAELIRMTEDPQRVKLIMDEMIGGDTPVAMITRGGRYGWRDEAYKSMLANYIEQRLDQMVQTREPGE